MRTELITKEIFAFSELSDSAKEAARDWFRGCIEADELADTDDWRTIAGIFGVEFATRSVPLMNGSTRQEPEIYWSGFSSQGDGACWTGGYSYAKGAPAAIRAHAPSDKELHRIADSLQDVQRRHFYRLQATVTTSGRYSHSGTMSADVTRTDGVDVPAADGDTVEQLLRDFAAWIYRQLEAQWTYLHSDEHVNEAIAGNEYEFTADGSIA